MATLADKLRKYLNKQVYIDPKLQKAAQVTENIAIGAGTAASDKFVGLLNQMLKGDPVTRVAHKTRGIQPFQIDKERVNSKLFQPQTPQHDVGRTIGDVGFTIADVLTGGMAMSGKGVVGQGQRLFEKGTLASRGIAPQAATRGQKVTSALAKSYSQGLPYNVSSGMNTFLREGRYNPALDVAIDTVAPGLGFLIGKTAKPAVQSIAKRLLPQATKEGAEQAAKSEAVEKAIKEISEQIGKSGDQPVKETAEQASRRFQFSKEAVDSAGNRIVQTAEDTIEQLPKGVLEAIEQSKQKAFNTAKQNVERVRDTFIKDGNAGRVDDNYFYQTRDAINQRLEKLGTDYRVKTTKDINDLDLDLLFKQPDSTPAGKQAIKEADEAVIPPRAQEVVEQAPPSTLQETPDAVKQSVKEADRITAENKLIEELRKRGEDINAFLRERNEFDNLHKRVEEGTLSEETKKTLKTFTDDLGKVYERLTGRKLQRITEGYLPRIDPAYIEADLTSIGGLPHKIKGYSPAAPRVLDEASPYALTDVAEISEAYIRSALNERDRVLIEAQRLGKTAEYVQRNDEIAEAVFEYVTGIKSTVKSTPEVAAKKVTEGTVDIMEKLAAKAADDGVLVGSKKIDKKIDGARRLLQTDQEKAYFYHPELGDAMTRYVAKDSYWSSSMDIINKALKEQNPDMNAVYSRMEVIDPLIDFTRLKKFVRLAGERSNGQELIEAHIGNTLKKSYDRLYSDDLINTFMQFKGDANFAKFQEDVLLETIGGNLRSEIAWKKILGFIREKNYAGALGLNIRSAVQNYSELRRAVGKFGIYTPKYLKMAFQDDFVPKDKKIFNMFPQFENANIYKETKSVTGQIAKGDKWLTEQVMRPFMYTENVKNKVFLYGFLEQGQSKGLSGNELIDYVVKNTRKYAIVSGQFSTPGMYKSDVVKTGLQFGQYSAREFVVTGREIRDAILKGDQESMKYVMGYLAGSAINYGVFVKLLQFHPMEMVLTLPGIDLRQIEDVVNGNKDYKQLFQFGPSIETTLMGMAVGKSILVDGNSISELEEMGDYNYHRFRQLLNTYIPAGNQLFNKSFKYHKSLQKGETSTISGKNTRHPQIENPYDMVMGYALGQHATSTSQNHYEWLKNMGLNSWNLNATQTEVYRNLQENQSVDDAINYYYKMREEKEKQELNKQHVEALISGEKEKKGILNIFKKADDRSIQTIDTQPNNELAQDYRPHDVLMSDLVEKAKMTELRNYGNTLIKGGVTDERFEQEMQRKAMELGVDYERYEMSRLKGMAMENKVEFISEMFTDGSIGRNLAYLYKEDILTREVARELYRKGIIPDADGFWKLATLTDVYYYDKEMQKLRDKAEKAAARSFSSQLKAERAVVKAQISSLKSAQKLIASNRTLISKGKINLAKGRKKQSIRSLSRSRGTTSVNTRELEKTIKKFQDLQVKYDSKL